MAYPHGVYNSEVDTSLTSPIQGSAVVQVCSVPGFVLEGYIRH